MIERAHGKNAHDRGGSSQRCGDGALRAIATSGGDDRVAIGVFSEFARGGGEFVAVCVLNISADA